MDDKSQMLDKSYIVRIYQKTAGAFNGVLEDVDKNKRHTFNTPEQLWALITRNQPVAGEQNIVAIDCARNSPVKVTQERNETAPLTKLSRLIPVDRTERPMPATLRKLKIINGVIK